MKLQRLFRPYVLLVVVNVLLQQLLQLLLHLHDRHDVALPTHYQQHDLVYDVFAMTQLRLHPLTLHVFFFDDSPAQATFRIERVDHKLNLTGLRPSSELLQT